MHVIEQSARVSAMRKGHTSRGTWRFLAGFWACLFASAQISAQTLPSLSDAITLDRGVAEQAKIDAMLQLHQLAQRASAARWHAASDSSARCEGRRTSFGLSLHEAGLYPTEFREVAAYVFGLDPGLPAIWAVVPGGPADMAGLRPGDTLVAVNDQALSGMASPQDIGGSTALARAQVLLDTLPAGADAEVSVVRAGILMTFSMAAQPVCLGSLGTSAGGDIAILAKNVGALAKLETARTDQELAGMIAALAAEPASERVETLDAMTAVREAKKAARQAALAVQRVRRGQEMARLQP